MADAVLMARQEVCRGFESARRPTASNQRRLTGQISRLIELGREDATRWTEESHDDRAWQRRRPAP